MSKDEYYSLKKIDETNAQYRLVYGERSNGKSFAVHLKALEDYVKNGNQFAIIRRMVLDLKGKRGAEQMKHLECDGYGVNHISRLTKGKWDRLFYYSERWYLAKWDEKLNKIVKEEEPFAYAFSLSAMEHDKSSSYPKVKTILFDEFMTRTGYLNDEFILFHNVISTIKRRRQDIVVYMLANTVNMYCPYFDEMGLYKTKTQKQGTIDIYEYGDSGLTVACEYVATPKDKKISNDPYFAFENPKLRMITDGAWEMNIYPHLLTTYSEKDILYMYFIKFGDVILQCEIIQVDDKMFTYIHRKTTPLKDKPNDLIYTLEYSDKPNYRRRLNRPLSELEKKICSFFSTEKVFYQSNPIGETVRNYLQACTSDNLYK